jgi:hypothetical protein
MTPQQKKALSLKKDCRNTYGQNDKASRKHIPRRKQRGNQLFRRMSRQVIRQGVLEMEELDEAVGAVARKGWKKEPDQPLGEVLRDDLLKGIVAALCSQSQDDPAFFPWLEQCLLDRRVPEVEVRVVMRRAKAVWTSNPVRLDIPHRVALLLEEILAGRRRPGGDTKTGVTKPDREPERDASSMNPGFSGEWRKRSRKWLKEIARVSVKSAADVQRIEAVVDAVCDVLGGLKSIDAVKQVFVEAFTNLGHWDSGYVADLLMRLSVSHPSATELLGDFCCHPSAEVRLRAAHWLPFLPKDIRAKYLPALLDDPDLAVRMKVSSEHIRAARTNMFRQLLAPDRKRRSI